MNTLRTAFYEEGKAADADGDPTSNCWLCGMPIDYSVPANTTPDSHNLDHYFPVSEYPELQEDPANFRHSHMDCNGERGADAPLPSLGVLSRAW